MAKKERLHYVDIAKGIAMLLVIIGHCSYSEKTLVGWLYSFHMPLFFALSGFTFRPEKYRSLREVIVVKFRQLIIPYFFFCTLLWALSLLLLDGMQLQYRHINEFIGILLSKRLSKYFFSLWFLTTLFLAEPLLWCLTRIAKGREAALVPVSIAAFSVGAVVLQALRGTYWSADLVPIALSFLLFGYLARSVIDHAIHASHEVHAAILAWGVNLLFFWLNYRQVGRSDLYYCKLGNPVYFFLSACGGIIGTLLFCRLLARRIALEYIGKHSLVFYAFESLAIPISERLLCATWGASALQSEPMLATILVLLLSCCMLGFTSHLFFVWKQEIYRKQTVHVFS